MQTLLLRWSFSKNRIPREGKTPSHPESSNLRNGQGCTGKQSCHRRVPYVRRSQTRPRTLRRRAEREKFSSVTNDHSSSRSARQARHAIQPTLECAFTQLNRARNYCIHLCDSGVGGGQGL